MTPYECVTDSPYSGMICRFGECVLAYLRPEGKSAPRWCHGLWLGKAALNDARIIGTKEGLFVTRSVRRFDEAFDSKRAAEFSVYVWEHGLASIGGQLVLSKRRPAPTAVPIPASEEIHVASFGVPLPSAMPEPSHAGDVAGSDVLSPVDHHP